MKLIRNIFFVVLISLFSVSTYAEMSEEEIIKGRKSLFSKNYRTAKRVDILSKDLEFEDAKKYMLVMKKKLRRSFKLFSRKYKRRIWYTVTTNNLGKQR